MGLIAYQQQTRLLLNDAGFVRFNDFDLVSFINIARGQIAGEAECIRVYASLAITAGTQQYPFSSITFPGSTLGVAGVLNVRMATFSPATAGQLMIAPREWEFFNTYVLAESVPVAGPPSIWAQFGQGANGTLFFNLPDSDYTVALDTVCFPSVLNADSDPEAVPYLWTDAVPYFAAYLALLTAQQADAAAAMLKLYQVFAARARAFATPSVLPHQYSQANDPEMSGRLGLSKAG